jgi:hypothetical protein
MQLRHVYHQMIGRCHDETHPRYSGWGEQGIRVCDRWRESFETWAEDMGPRPPGTAIERKDNGGHYSPENCEWKTPKEQARNTCLNHNVTAFGKTQSLAAWAEETGIDRRTLWKRITEGWKPEDALRRKVRKQSPPISPEEKKLILKMREDGASQSKIAKATGRSQAAIGRWLKRWRS